MSHRFDVKPVSEPDHVSSSDEPSESHPLVRIEHEITPLPTVTTVLYQKNKSRAPSRLLNTILQRKSANAHRRATVATPLAPSGSQIKKSSSADAINKLESESTISCPTSQKNIALTLEIDEPDVYSTTQSSHYDTNPTSISNKFLQELRTKRHELHRKWKNMPIDQRIAFYRRQNSRTILRAQDIFDVHFALPDDDDEILSEPNIFTEEYQEKVRNEIYNELTRQRVKQYDKQNRQLVVGRALFMFTASILIIMAAALIYVVIRLFMRAKHSDARLPEDTFIPLIADTTKNLY